MSDLPSISRFLANEAATLDLGEAWSSRLNAPLVIYLEGDLGAGKTTLTRGILRGLGHRGPVKSPTYAIVESYPLKPFTLHHFDLYRFTTPEEWEDAGLDELFSANSVCLIEWPQQGGIYPACRHHRNIDTRRRRQKMPADRPYRTRT